MRINEVTYGKLKTPLEVNSNLKELKPFQLQPVCQHLSSPYDINTNKLFFCEIVGIDSSLQVTQYEKQNSPKVFS